MNRIVLSAFLFIPIYVCPALAIPHAQPMGDFNWDGELSAADIDLLAGELATGSQVDLSFDLDGDGVVNREDVNVWVSELMGTWPGDANLDGEFNSGDLVNAFMAGKYETDHAASWDEGDWNLDRKFDSTDFVVAFSGGGYESGPRYSRSVTVPEPTHAVPLLASSLSILGLTRRRRLAIQ